jgi:hypothetical protein
MEVQIEAIEKLIFCARYPRNVAIKRWRSLNGQNTVLEVNGGMFVHIAGERLREVC